MFVLQFKDQEVYIADWTNGDPPRTLVLKHSRLFKTEKAAIRSKQYFEREYSFRRMDLIPVEVDVEYAE